MIDTAYRRAFRMESARLGFHASGSIPAPMITDTEIRRRFQHHPPRDQHTVDAHRRVREVLCDAALTINNMLVDGPDKRKALDALELARVHANTSIALEGPAA